MVGNWEKSSPEQLEIPPVMNSERLPVVSLPLLIGIMRGLNQKESSKSLQALNCIVCDLFTRTFVQQQTWQVRIHPGAGRRALLVLVATLPPAPLCCSHGSVATTEL